MPRALLLIPAVVAALAVAGCGVRDDGARTAQTRDVPAFTRVENADSVDVRLHVGEPRRVVVLAGEKVIDDVRTEVHDGTLQVTFDHDGFGGSDVTVEASVPELTGIEVSGSGDVDADGLDGDAFDVRSDGSADIGLAGSVDQLAVDVSGSGDADMSGLTARAARVVVDGSGDVDVSAEQRVDVSVDGSGDVRIHGNPAVSQRSDGSGDIHYAD
jgi:Putative auto-transporter adhesin, head GIN domain